MNVYVHIYVKYIFNQIAMPHKRNFIDMLSCCYAMFCLSLHVLLTTSSDEMLSLFELSIQLTVS